MNPIISAQEHYDRLAESGNGLNDPPALEEYMARWDGPLFYEALGDLTGKDVLEVGVGVGRIARRVLGLGCGSLTGLDISSKTIEAARSEFPNLPNIELVLADISDFCRPESFDIAYSVLTFMHVQSKQKALRNMVDSLREGGRVLLSVHHSSDLLDMVDWSLTLYPWTPEQYTETLRGLGCAVEPPVPLIDRWSDSSGVKSETYGDAIATLVMARKP